MDAAKEIGSNERNRRIVEREYLNVRELSAYSGLGVRTIWSFLKDATNPLPHIRIGRKIIRIKRTDFDAWIGMYYVSAPGRNSTADRIVRRVMDDFRKRRRPRSGAPIANSRG
jgi:predicted DNA-binding transcriptional regulator AlpA